MYLQGSDTATVFIPPEEDEKWYEYWKETRKNWYLMYGMREDHLRLREHEKSELAHYAKACADVEFLYPWGWDELEGIANRTNFDLNTHQEHSGKDLTYYNEQTKERYLPYVILLLVFSGALDYPLLYARMFFMNLFDLITFWM